MTVVYLICSLYRVSTVTVVYLICSLYRETLVIHLVIHFDSLLHTNVMCSFQISLSSVNIPKNFVTNTLFISFLLMLTLIVVFLCLELQNSMNFVLDKFNRKLC